MNDKDYSKMLNRFQRKYITKFIQVENEWRMIVSVKLGRKKVAVSKHKLALSNFDITLVDMCGIEHKLPTNHKICPYQSLPARAVKVF